MIILNTLCALIMTSGCCWFMGASAISWSGDLSVKLPCAVGDQRPEIYLVSLRIDLDLPAIWIALQAESVVNPVYSYMVYTVHRSQTVARAVWPRQTIQGAVISALECLIARLVTKKPFMLIQLPLTLKHYNSQ